MCFGGSVLRGICARFYYLGREMVTGFVLNVVILFGLSWDARLQHHISRSGRLSWGSVIGVSDWGFACLLLTFQPLEPTLHPEHFPATSTTPTWLAAHLCTQQQCTEPYNLHSSYRAACLSTHQRTPCWPSTNCCRHLIGHKVNYCLMRCKDLIIGRRCTLMTRFAANNATEH